MFDKEMRDALEADGEKLRRMTGIDNGPYFAGGDCATTVTVRYWGACNDGRQAPHRLVEFQDALEDAIAEIPKAHLDSAVIEFEPDFEYGEAYSAVRITYDRPETPEETAARIDGERAHWSEQLASARDRATYCMAQLDSLPVKRRV